MTDNTAVFAGLLLPLLGTSLGAGFVFLLRGAVSDTVQTVLNGLAAGIMTAASVWSLIIPSVSMAEEHGDAPWIPAAVGFMAGILFLLCIDTLVPQPHPGAEAPERCSFSRSSTVMLAVTLHNLPEGMAVGVILSALLAKVPGVTAASAMALTVGIALQNVPEGAIISMPLTARGLKKGSSFLMGVLSGTVEPAGAAAAMLLTGIVSPALPYILSFAAGAMMYVVLEELIPETHSGGRAYAGTLSAAAGFTLMMVLDIALG